MRHDKRVTLCSLVDFRIRKLNEAFGLAAGAGERAQSGQDKKAEWSGGFEIQQVSLFQGECKSAVFANVVFPGELKRPQSCARGKTF